MSHIKPLSETPESVTLSRADFDAILEELEDAEDRMAVLEDCLLDLKPEQNRYLLSMADTMRIIDGVNPITVWREKRDLSLAALAAAVGLTDQDVALIESGAAMGSVTLGKIAAALDILPGMLASIRGPTWAGENVPPPDAMVRP